MHSTRWPTRTTAVVAVLARQIAAVMVTRTPIRAQPIGASSLVWRDLFASTTAVCWSFQDGLEGWGLRYRRVGGNAMFNKQEATFLSRIATPVTEGLRRWTG